MMGGFDKKTVKGVSLKGKRVLLRADYNVPPGGDKVTEGYRIEASLPTIRYLLEKDASAVVIISHLGRPAGKPDAALSLKPVAQYLQQKLGKPVEFAGDCVGAAASQAASNLPPGGILLLENLRFHAGEESNDAEFAKQLVEASGADILVQDGFGVVHRKHASTDAITKLLPAVAGLLLEKEVTTIERALREPERPLVAVIGGAKVSDKIELIERFVELADCVCIAGAMANNFLLAEGHKLGKSLVEKTDHIGAAKKILQAARVAEARRQFRLILPTDVVVSTARDGSKPTRVVDYSFSLADIEAYPKLPPAAKLEVQADEMILDIGPGTAARIAGIVQMSRSVIWNGTCGVTEAKGLAGASAPFSHGTANVVEAMIGGSRKHANKPFSLAGGGDTASYLEQNKLIEDFDFVSTGGGASLELMTGHKLPGIEALQVK